MTAPGHTARSLRGMWTTMANAAPVHEDVDHQRQYEADPGGEHPQPPEGPETGQGATGDEPDAQHDQESGGPGDPVPEVGQVVAVDVPHRGHHHLGGPAQLRGAVEQPEGPDDHDHHVGRRELVDVGPNVGPEHRELTQGGVDDLVLEGPVPVEERPRPA